MSYYDAEYYLAGTKSGYGGKFHPYIEEAKLPIAQEHARQIKTIFNPTNVLVLGCARGYLVRALIEQGIEAEGIDISQWAIENSDKIAKPYIYQDDITTCLVAYEEQGHDVTVAFDVLEHIEKSKLYKTIEEVCRITKEYILLHVPIIDNGVDKTHVSILPEYWWKTQFSMHGFKSVYSYIYEQNDGITALIVNFKRK